MNRRHIVYVSGTRADFGLLEGTLQRANADPRLAVSVCVTGMHLSPRFGETVREVEASGVPVLARIPVDLDPGSGSSMAMALGQALIGITTVLAQSTPDLMLILGDRGEMLAGALAALHLNIPIAHLHGGECSGTVDEPVRHAISKLAHYHFVATQGARERLVRMGEDPDCIFLTGAPGIDALVQHHVARSRSQLCAEVGFDPDGPVALVVFHPVVQEAARAGTQTHSLMAAVRGEGLQALCLMPNADAGNASIREAYRQFADGPGVRLVTHLPRSNFIDWMAAADMMVGNSSSGIIEAASLGLPVVNVGERQHGRERSGNVVDCPPEVPAIRAAIVAAAGLRGRSFTNVYGDGHAGERVVNLLATLPLTSALLHKRNAY